MADWPVFHLGFYKRITSDAFGIYFTAKEVLNKPFGWFKREKLNTALFADFFLSHDDFSNKPVLFKGCIMFLFLSNLFHGDGIMLLIESFQFIRSLFLFKAFLPEVFLFEVPPEVDLPSFLLWHSLLFGLTVPDHYYLLGLRPLCDAEPLQAGRKMFSYRFFWDLVLAHLYSDWILSSGDLIFIPCRILASAGLELILKMCSMYSQF